MLENELDINEFVETVSLYLVRYYGYEENEAYKAVLSSKVLSYIDSKNEIILNKDIKKWAELVDCYRSQGQNRILQK